jgi:hypothetical protein
MIALRLAVCAAAAATLLSATPAAAAPSGTVTWGVAPSTAKGPDGRSSFDYETEAAKAVKDYVAVTNDSAGPATFKVYASDAVNTPTGGFDLLAGDDKPTDVGAWVRLAKQTITIPGHARANIPFTLTIPANATPGDHVGGIVAVLQDTSKAAIKVDHRVGSRIYLRVRGALAPSLAVTGLGVTYHSTINPFGGGDVTAEYDVRNTGNVRLAAGQQVTVRGFGAKLGSATPAALPEVLPGQSVHVSVRLSAVAPLGPLETEVTLNPSAVKGEQHLADLSKVTLGTAHKSVVLWALPWPQLLLLIVLAAFGWLVFRLQRRRQQRIQQALAEAVAAARREERAANLEEAK